MLPAATNCLPACLPAAPGFAARIHARVRPVHRADALAAVLHTHIRRPAGPAARPAAQAPRVPHHTRSVLRDRGQIHVGGILLLLAVLHDWILSTVLLTCDFPSKHSLALLMHPNTLLIYFQYIYFYLGQLYYYLLYLFI